MDVQVRPDHTLFNRDGDNLVVELPVGFAQAALGATVEVPTLKGRTEFKISRGTQHGDVYKHRRPGFSEA